LPLQDVQSIKDLDGVERFDSSIDFLFPFALATLFALLGYENRVGGD